MLEPEIVANRARAISIRPEEDPVINDPRVSIQIETCTAELLTVDSENSGLTLREDLIRNGYCFDTTLSSLGVIDDQNFLTLL